MTNELNWLRGKAKQTQTDTLVITPDEAIAAECQPGTYRVEYFAFRGTVPYRMARALVGSKLTNTETESEVLHLGNGYRGGEGQCRYYRTVYTLLAA
jgi:hypothetical protein